MKKQEKEPRPGVGGTRLPRTEAAVKAYRETGSETDPLGMWTGCVHQDKDGASANDVVPEVPVQDADDL